MLELPWVQYTPKMIKVLKSDSLNHKSVSSISLQIFREHALSPYMEKSLGNGITVIEQGWLVRIESADLRFVGNIYIQLAMQVDGKPRVQPISSQTVMPLHATRTLTNRLFLEDLR